MVGLGLSASRDGPTIFFARVDSSGDELMLVEKLSMKAMAWGPHCYRRVDVPLA